MFYIAEGTSIHNHVDELNFIIIDLESLYVKIEDEDKAILLVVSLPPSYKHFKEIILYSNNVVLSFKDLRLTYYPKRSLILICVLMTKLKVSQ